MGECLKPLYRIFSIYALLFFTTTFIIQPPCYGRACCVVFIHFYSAGFNGNYKTTTSNDAKMLYALLLDRMELSRANNWVDSDGTIFLIFKREDLADMLGICTTTVWRAIKQLKEVGLIAEKRQGLNKPNLIYIGKIDYSVPE